MSCCIEGSKKKVEEKNREAVISPETEIDFLIKYLTCYFSSNTFNSFFMVK